MAIIAGVTVDRANVGTKIVYTSPEVAGLFVALSPEDDSRAEASIRSALEALRRAANARGPVQDVQRVRQERQYA